MSQEPTGLSHAFKSAIPLISRVGVIAGGLVTLLTVLLQASGEIITAVEAFFLVAGLVTSGLMVWGRTSKTVDGKTVHTPLYPRKQRRIAGGVFAIAILLTLAFAYRTVPELIARANAPKVAVATATPTPSGPTPTLSLSAQRTLAVEQSARSTVLARSGWPLVLSDTFARNTNGWAVGAITTNLGPVNMEIKDGKYRWKLTVSSAGGMRQVPKVKDVADFDFALGTKRMTGPLGAEYGVVFRYVDDNNFYRFSLVDDGRVIFQTKYQGAFLPSLIKDHVSAVHPGESNRIGVSAQGSHFIFLVNDQYVTEGDDDRLKSGKVGINVVLFNPNDEGSFEFDDFQLRAP